MNFPDRLYKIGLLIISTYANKNAQQQNEMSDMKSVLLVLVDLFKKWWRQRKEG